MVNICNEINNVGQGNESNIETFLFILEKPTTWLPIPRRDLISRPMTLYVGRDTIETFLHRFKVSVEII
jgi:hypothetical protein